MTTEQITIPRKTFDAMWEALEDAQAFITGGEDAKDSLIAGGLIDRVEQALAAATALDHSEQHLDMVQPQVQGGLPSIEVERKNAEREYSYTAHNYPKAPIGSRDWMLYWAGWLARSTAPVIKESLTAPEGWKLVPVEPTPEIIAAAAIAVWPVASIEDIEMARKAAPIVLMQYDLGHATTVESLAAALATMAPAYRAMIAAAPEQAGKEGV